MKYLRSAAPSVLLLLLLTPQGRADERLLRFLNDEVEQKVFTFRNFYVHRVLHYDQHGRVVGKPRAGPWTLAGFAVEKAELKPGALRLRGFRVAREVVAPRTFNLLRVPEEITVTVDLPSPRNRARIERLIGRIFFRKDEEVVSRMPRFWREYLSSAIELRPVDLSEVRQPTVAVNPRSCGDGGGYSIQFDLRRKRDPFQVEEAAPPQTAVSFSQWPGIASWPDGDPFNSPPWSTLPKQKERDVVAPMVAVAAEARYTQAACLAGVQKVLVLGLRIGLDGRLEEVWLVRPGGVGLDEQAIRAVRRSKFSPGMRDGKPAVMNATAQAVFRLY